jgi:transposase
MRTLPILGEERVKELKEVWRQKHDERSRKRLQVIRLVAQHELNAGQIAQATGMHRCTVFRYIDSYMQGGVEQLLGVNYAKRPSRARMSEATQQALKEQLHKGNFKRAKEAQAWLKARKVQMALSSVYRWLGKLGGVLKVPRKVHVKKKRIRSRPSGKS